MTEQEYRKHLEKLLRGLENDDYLTEEAGLLRLQFEVTKELYRLDNNISSIIAEDVNNDR